MKDFWKKRWFVGAVYALLAILISVQKLVQTAQSKSIFLEPTAYENYVIFKNSFRHLYEGWNLFTAFPLEQWDLFKYSPAFALFMAPFSLVPDTVGLSVWNLLNALSLFSAIFSLPVLTERQKIFFAWFVLPELLVSIQNSQSNGLTAAMLLLAYGSFEKQRSAGPAFWVAASTFIKIFGIFAAALLLLYPQKGRFTAWLLSFCLFFAIIPLLVVAPDRLWQMYGWWLDMLQGDQAASVGLSVQGWLQSWFGLELPKMAITLFGLCALLLSVLVTGRAIGWGNKDDNAVAQRARAMVWASLLIWVVIFNHKAESPTFIIALCGAALWYCFSKRGVWEKVLLWTIFFFASVTPTDLFPRTWLNEWVQPYVLKAVPCIVLWGIIMLGLRKTAEH